MFFNKILNLSSFLGQLCVQYWIMPSYSNYQYQFSCFLSKFSALSKIFRYPDSTLCLNNLHLHSRTPSSYLDNCARKTQKQRCGRVGIYNHLIVWGQWLRQLIQVSYIVSVTKGSHVKKIEKIGSFPSPFNQSRQIMESAIVRCQ